jgi:peptidoglycan hydrolase CwlO-like protein
MIKKWIVTCKGIVLCIGFFLIFNAIKKKINDIEYDIFAYLDYQNEKLEKMQETLDDIKQEVDDIKREVDDIKNNVDYIKREVDDIKQEVDDIRYKLCC